MKILFFLTAFLILSFTPIVYAEPAEPAMSDEDFIKWTNEVKDPFQDGLPKPAAARVPVVETPLPPPVVKPKPEPPPPIVLPDLNVQGVMIGDGMREAIIDDQEIGLYHSIKGAELLWVNKKGIVLRYKGKKFFLKVD